MSTSIDKLKQDIYDSFSNDEQMDKLLVPVCNFTQNSDFTTNIKNIVVEIVKDRDGNNVFTVNDLNFLSKDILAVTSIITGLLLVVKGIPNYKIKYVEIETEILVFKLLLYLFLVAVPEEAHIEWSTEDKYIVVDTVTSIYNMYTATLLIKDVLNNVSKLFGFTCCRTKDDAVVEKHLPVVKRDIRANMHRARDMAEMDRKLIDVQAKLDTYV